MSLMSMAKEIEPSIIHESATGQKATTNMITDFRIQNQNSVYYLKPGTQDTYILDLKQKAFSRQPLFWHTSMKQRSLPIKFSSVQAFSGQIYTIGGLYKKDEQYEAYNGCLKVDNNFKVSELPDKMSTGRYNAPVALL